MNGTLQEGQHVRIKLRFEAVPQYGRYHHGVSYDYGLSAARPYIDQGRRVIGFRHDDVEWIEPWPSVESGSFSG